MLQHIRNVLISGFSVFAMLRDQLAPPLIDLRRRVLLRADLPRRLQDQFFLRCLRIAHIAHRPAPRCAPAPVGLGVIGPAGAPLSGEGVAALAPPGFFNNCRYFVTFLLCSSSDAAKKCPPCVFATKYKNGVFVGLIAALNDSSPGMPIAPGGSPVC